MEKLISIVDLSLVLLGIYWLRWIIWKRKEIPFVVPILFTCFFLPKLNLISVSELSTAGIRIDDFLALILLLVAIMDPATYRNKAIKWGTLVLILLSVVNLLSVFFGRMQGYENQVLLSVLMVIRKFEYCSFALVGIYAARKVKHPYKVFYSEFTWMNLMHILPAVLQVITKVSYAVNGRNLGDYLHGTAVSTFNGYYEYGQFLCFSCAIYICDLLSDREKARIWKTRIPVSLVMLPITLVMLYLSKSRSSLVIGVVLILIAIYFPIRKTVSRTRLIYGGYGAIVILAGVTVLLTGILGLEITSRFGEFDMGNFRTWKELLNRGNLSEYTWMLRTEYFEFVAINKLGYLDKISDWSMANRLMKWGAALDGLKMNPLLGYGMGVTHVMDGNYIRLLGETGLLGTAIWFIFYGGMMRFVWKARNRSRIGKAVLLMMLSILMNSIMIDMFDASKPMEMMWLLVGAVLAFDPKLNGSRIPGLIDPALPNGSRVPGLSDPILPETETVTGEFPG